MTVTLFGSQLPGMPSISTAQAAGIQPQTHFSGLEEAARQELIGSLDQPFRLGLTRRKVLQAVLALTEQRKSEVEDQYNNAKTEYDQQKESYDAKMNERAAHPFRSRFSRAPKAPRIPWGDGQFVWLMPFQVAGVILKDVQDKTLHEAVSNALYELLEMMEQEGLLTYNVHSEFVHPEYATAEELRHAYRANSLTQSLEEEIRKPALA